MSQKVLLLGASGWIGSYLQPLLGRECIPAHALQLRSTNLDPLTKLPACHVINLARGEDDQGFRLHQALIEFTNRHGTRYHYASSFNAVDADLSKPHHESDPPSAQSPYGQFKARCERELAAHAKNWAVFRFPAVHGWAPNRVARTEEFLRKLKGGEPVRVSTGVVQNRIFAGDLARLMAEIAGGNEQGVFHLGARDSSEELDFLRRLAAAFGYDTGLVQPGEASPCNAVMLSARLKGLPSEAETLARTRAQPELAGYVSAF